MLNNEDLERVLWSGCLGVSQVMANDASGRGCRDRTIGRCMSVVEASWLIVVDDREGLKSTLKVDRGSCSRRIDQSTFACETAILAGSSPEYK